MSDLSPVDGPALGPFRFRSEALAAERRWTETHRLVAGDSDLRAETAPH